MNIVVPIKQVPDLAEELEVDGSGKALDSEWLRFKLNEFDDHALEEALQLKEEQGATVTVIALDSHDADKALYSAAAKGADTLVKISGDFGDHPSSHAEARAFADALAGIEYDLILTGVQAVDDLDGQKGIILAHYLDVPHVSVVTEIAVNGNQAVVHKEYAGGVIGEFEVDLPAVLGVQAARETPRYAPVSRVRRAMKTSTIDEIAATGEAVSSGSTIERMFKPESGQGAEMLSGSSESIADQLVSIMREKGVKV